MTEPVPAKRQRVRRRIDHAATEPPVVLERAVDAATPVSESHIENPIPPVDPIADVDACVLGHKPNVIRYQGRLCRRHFESIASRLDQIVELYATLPFVVIPGPGGDGRGSTSIHSPAPGRLDVMAFTDRRANGTQRPPSPHADPDDEAMFDVLSVLGSWVQRVWLERDIDPRPAPAPTFDNDMFGPTCWRGLCIHRSCIKIRRDGEPITKVTLVGCTNELRKHRHWIAQQPWAPKFLAALELAHRSLARAAGDSMWAKPIGKCPNCQIKLYNQPRDDGLDMVTCPRCETVWTGVHLMRLRLIHKQEAR